MEQLSPEIVSAARTVLEDLRGLGITLGGAYEGALVSAADGGAAATGALVVVAIEAGRQAARPPIPAPSAALADAASAVEIVTLCRFRAAGREFEPNQRYRLTAPDFAEVEWRAAIEPNTRLYSPATA